MSLEGKLKDAVELLETLDASANSRMPCIAQAAAKIREQTEEIERLRAALETIHELLRPAAPEPTPSEEKHDWSCSSDCACNFKGEEQPDLPLGHPFEECKDEDAYCLRCHHPRCGQPESAHRRKP